MTPSMISWTSFGLSDAARARHMQPPLLEERGNYLCYRKSIGMDLRNLRSLSATLSHVVVVLELNTPRIVTEHQVDAAGERWAARSKESSRRRGGPFSKLVFVTAARGFLRFHRLLDPETPPQPFAYELSRYLKMQQDERGIAAATLKSYTLHLSLFLRWAGERVVKLSDLTPADITTFVEHKKLTCRRAAVAVATQPLKAFFAFGESQGWCRGDLGEMLVFPQRQRVNPDMLIPSWQAVRRILDEGMGDGPSELRSRAMLLLAAVYGLRSSEIARLRLRDIDWRDETMTIVRSKSGRIQQFPIQNEVGEAILRYVQESRPLCDCKHLFVSRTRPFRPVTPITLNLIAAKRFDLLGIEASSRGPHILRHACATQLLRTGSSLRQIADFLGHRDLTTVSVYVRCDLKAFEEVANHALARHI